MRVLSMSVSWKRFWVCLFPCGFLNRVSTYILHPWGGGGGGVGLNWRSGASFWSVLSPTNRLVYQYMILFSLVSDCSISADFFSKGCCPVFILLL